MNRAVRIATTLFAFTLALSAQSTTSLSGTVLDESGAILGNAQVVCRSPETGFTRAVATNNDGIFRCTELPIGLYEVTVTHPGFQTLRQENIELVTASAVDLKFTMRVGQVTDKVEVTGEAPLVETSASSVQTSVTQRQMQDLPLNGRNPLQLVALTAGATLSDTGTIPGQQDNTGISVNGQRVTQNNVRLDGGNYNNRFFNSIPIMPNPDTLQEFTVRSSGTDASASGSGAVIELSTRSGTNELHFTAFEFLRNTVLDARNFFQLTRPPFKQNQYGGTGGAPIRKDKTFFFGSYQRTSQRSSPSSAPTITVPNAAQRQGDFSGVSNPLVDPLTNAAFPGNIIPASRIDPVGAEVLKLFIPLPNAGTQYVSQQASNLDDWQYLAKVDQVLDDRNRLSGRWFQDFNDFQRATSTLSTFYAQNYFRNKSLTVRDTQIFTPALTMTNAFTATRFGRNQVPVSPGLVTMQELGANAPLASNVDLYPGIRYNVTGYFNLLSGGALQQIPQSYLYDGSVSYGHGRHTLQAGFFAERTYTFYVDASNVPGTWTFSGARTSLPSIPRSGLAIADALLGVPNQFQQGSVGDIDTTESRYQVWAQDNWKVSSRLTLNLGIRWEPWLPPVDKFGSIVGWKPGVQSTIAPNAPRGVVYPGDPGVPQSVYSKDWNNLAPRVGFAWDVAGNQKTVIRAAYGIFYDSLIGGSYARAFEMQPNVVLLTIANPKSTQNPFGNVAGGSPFPYAFPPLSAYKTYKFVTPLSGGLVNTATPTGYTQNWNFTVERQIRGDLAVSASYVGSHSIKILGSAELNPAVYGPTATTGNTDARRIYASLGLGQLFGESPYQWARYNALQLNVTKRASRGLTLLVNYSYGKVLDIYSNAQAGGAGPRDPFNYGLDKGPADFDVRQRLNAAFVYETPHVRSTSALTNALLNGWQLNGIGTVASGLPTTITSGRDNSFSGIGKDGADLIGNPARPAGVDPVLEWFNTGAYTANAVGTWGTVGRNTLRGPGLERIDLAVFRNFRLTERIHLQFRAEAFNVANRANFATPVSGANGNANVESVSAANFGRITAAGDPRVYQFGLKLMR